MKKLKNCAGFSLLEMLAAVGILVILVVGMQAGITAGVREYGDAVFESNACALADIMDTTLGDILRYSEDIELNPHLENPKVPGFQDSYGNILTPDQVRFEFCNYEYGIRNGYFWDGSSEGCVQIKDLQNNPIREVVNTGAYPDLRIEIDEITFYPPDPGTKAPENYFHVHYKIFDTKKDTRAPKDIEYTVRRLNPDL